MNRKDLPERWALKINQYLKLKGSKYESLSAGDFHSNKTIEIEFEDGSFAQFKYPLVIEAPEWEEIGVMTEHWGYFLFHQDTITYKLKPINQ